MHPDIRIDRFGPADIVPFLALACQEGWICDRWEFEFHLETFPQGCFVARCNDEPVGFITALRHDHSGWIGNLLVREDLRGCGIGRALMQESLAALRGAGVMTVWLTASSDGKPLYEKLGFVTIDIVQRWRGTGAVDPGSTQCVASSTQVLQLDKQGWGDSREKLLSATLARGELLENGEGFLIVQRTGAGIQFGPWGGFSAEGATWLLAQARSRFCANDDIFLDSPRGNRGAAELLADQGFRVSGATHLMCHGDVPLFSPNLVYALASMGSMG